jgi:hypothetical protein
MGLYNYTCTFRFLKALGNLGGKGQPGNLQSTSSRVVSLAVLTFGRDEVMNWGK